MPAAHKTKVALTMLYLVIIVASVGLIARGTPRAIPVALSSDQARYAEVPASAAQASSTIAAIETTPVPIVVYHIVRPAYPSDSLAVRRLAQTPEVFDAELLFLAQEGYSVISFGALEAHVRDATPLPPHPIIISFDDGWRDQFEYAFPILQKYGDTATFFVFTNPIGTRGFLTWDNLHTMLQAGMTIGSHSLSHPFLTRISDPTKLWNEIAESKQVLEEHLGITVNEFAYPFGQYDATTTLLVKKAGYLAARGDYVKNGSEQTINQLYALSALNAPTTTARFAQIFRIR